MAKKFGKFLLFTAAAGSAAAAVYYYLQKKEAANKDTAGECGEEASCSSHKHSDEASSEKKHSDDAASRNYVPLSPEPKTTSPEADQKTGTDQEKPEDTFTPLSQQLSQSSDSTGETVEEFFDEEDSDEAEPEFKEE